ncbi:MAG TPA: hypothetical protein EYN67_00470 [Flavobacteriales bacterium]|nr:hypothetical protein [Flavobacteriales bacterium]
MTETNHTMALDPNKESLKITKNSRGYSWEFKLLCDKLDEKQLRRTSDVDDWLIARFGGSDV